MCQTVSILIKRATLISFIIYFEVFFGGIKRLFYQLAGFPRCLSFRRNDFLSISFRLYKKNFIVPSLAKSVPLRASFRPEII